MTNVISLYEVDDEDLVSTSNPLYSANRKELKAKLNEILRTLNLREQIVIKALFFEGIGPEELGKLLNRSRTRIYQIRNKALRKLMHPCRSKPLRPFMDGREEDIAYIERSVL